MWQKQKRFIINTSEEWNNLMRATVKQGNNQNLCPQQGGELHVRKRRSVEKSRKPGDGQQVRFTPADVLWSCSNCVTTFWLADGCSMFQKISSYVRDLVRDKQKLICSSSKAHKAAAVSCYYSRIKTILLLSWRGWLVGWVDGGVGKEGLSVAAPACH